MQSAGAGSSEMPRESKRGSWKHISKRTTKEIMRLLLNGARNTETKNMKEGEITSLPCFLLVKSALRLLIYMSLLEKPAGARHYLQ